MTYAALHHHYCYMLRRCCRSQGGLCCRAGHTSGVAVKMMGRLITADAERGRFRARHYHYFYFAPYYFVPPLRRRRAYA